MAIYAIIGANRGLGLEFTKQVLAAGHSVRAVCRNPAAASELQQLTEQYADTLTIRAGDVTNEGSLEASGTELEHVDVLINNAGVMGQSEADLSALSIEEMSRVLDINVFGIIRSVRSYLPLLKKGTLKKVANISSLMGSISDNGSGGRTGYRVSKAAVNMLTKNLSYELKSDGIIVIALHPGWVQTDMGGSHAPLTPAESISAMLATIEAKSEAESGQFFDRNGEVIPY